jgi:hypothetical protein
MTPLTIEVMYASEWPHDTRSAKSSGPSGIAFMSITMSCTLENGGTDQFHRAQYE